MNFQSMEYFTAVARERSFTKAAGQLHITQQTLSAAIGNLEKELQCELFIRHVPLELTYAGEVFLQYAEKVIKDEKDLLHEMQEISVNQKGVLKVGIGNTRGRAIMPSLINAFNEEYPNYSIEIREATNQELQTILVEEEIDVAIAYFGKEFPGVDLYPCYEEHIVLLIEKELFDRLYPNQLKSIRKSLKAGDFSPLRSCPFVLCRDEDMTGKVAGFFLKSSGISLKQKVLSDNVETLLALCRLGIGACFCPDNLLEATLSEEEQDKLYRFELNEEASYGIHFAIRKDAAKRRTLASFIKTGMSLLQK